MGGYGHGYRRVYNAAAATVEARVRPTTLATLAEWMERNGYPARNKSELVRQALEVLEGHLVATGQATRIESTEQALEYLDEIGLTGFNRNRRGQRALMQQLQREEQMEGWLQPREAKTMQPVGLLDRNGGLLISTMQQLSKLGYGAETPFDNQGNGLPTEVMELLRKGQLPPKISQQQESLAELQPSEYGQTTQPTPTDRPETLEEAAQRRAQEAKAQRVAMMEALKASREERSKDEDI